MNKGFLMFSEEEPGLTMLKDEPDDLTHLAPTAGDACIPLEETGPFFNDIFDDFMIPDSYRSLLQEELNSLDSSEHRLGSSSSISVQSAVSPITLNGTTITMVSHHNSNNSNTTSSPLSSHSSINAAATSPSPSTLSSASSSSLSTTSSPLNVSAGSPSGTSGIGTASSLGSASQNSSISQNCHTVDASSNDPFINYRDEICENSHSPHLLSPGLSKSPEGSSIPSLCSPNGSGCPEDELAFMTLNMDDDLDLSMRAPYISMSEVDDLPLLTSDDLMWGSTTSSVNRGIDTGKYLFKQELTTGLLQQQENATVGKSVGTVNRTHLGTNSGSSNSLNNNNENNCNIGNKIIDSSLAALLCGNVINIQPVTIQPNNNAQISIQGQQQQTQSMPVEVPTQQRETVGEKKIKLIESNMVHPMVVIGPGFKSSNTIETWTMNDLLQLNGANRNGLTGTLIPANNPNVIASMVSKKNSTNSNNTSTTNKRSLASSESGTDNTSKRVKSITSVSTIQEQSPTSSPQLLQQLMAPSPVPAKSKSKSKAGADQTEHRWPTGKLSGLQEQSSNSVLMNLLVSGCDVSAGYTCFPRPSKAAKA